ncbi:hypothetical protein [Mesorhizobium sp. INR15]|uniref:hypothetical protein n=1 Tax=Mesorhizobium sp. INR15 TaxID=2654248 RepID=UPI0018967A59|nr:hypothetical protein [Mesorhizobium sp. INR15]QPC93701.1 hypothetical protein GA829_25700 [Mesorhizobium sp. INR15]
MSQLSFRHLNTDWNAEPNAPDVELTVEGDVVRLSFLLNPWAYDAKVGEIGTLRFVGCDRLRWDATNDHAWFAGKGRYSNQAPEWGEFYEVIGDDHAINDLDWEVLSQDSPNSRHFLFYFRDETIEFFAQDWSLTRKMPKGG